MRAGIQSLMRDAAEKKFDLVLAEALDRFSRDQEDIAHLATQLNLAPTYAYACENDTYRNLLT